MARVLYMCPRQHQLMNCRATHLNVLKDVENTKRFIKDFKTQHDLFEELMQEVYSILGLNMVWYDVVLQRVSDTSSMSLVAVRD